MLADLGELASILPDEIVVEVEGVIPTIWNDPTRLVVRGILSVATYML